MIKLNLMGTLLEIGFDKNNVDMIIALKDLLTFIKPDINPFIDYTLSFKLYLTEGNNYYYSYDIRMDNTNDLNLFPSKYSEKLISRLDTTYSLKDIKMKDIKYLLVWLKQI